MKVAGLLTALAALFGLLVGPARASRVVELASNNFTQHVGGARHALVEFYAPWCGHCKGFAPEYELVASQFAFMDRVEVCRVDATANVDLAKQNDVTGYPTFRWFPAGGVDPVPYYGGQSAEVMTEWVGEQLGVHIPFTRPQEAVVALSTPTFDATVFDPSKAVMVEFYAPWCAHCKDFAPTYEKLARVYEAETSVIVAKIDATKYRAIAERFDVSGFPTLKFFNLDDGPVESYRGDRDVPSLVKFINERAATHRRVDGSLDSTAGIIPEMKDVVTHIDQQSIESARSILRDLPENRYTSAQVYLKAMQKVVDVGPGYIVTELERLRKMIESPAVSQLKKSEFMVKRNIIGTFGVKAGGAAAADGGVSDAAVDISPDGDVRDVGGGDGEAGAGGRNSRDR